MNVGDDKEEVKGVVNYDSRVQWPANPDYGSGVFRRRVQVCSAVSKVTVELEDCNHGFRVCLYHKAGKVTQIAADTIRYPHNTCPEAVKQLRQFIGLPINTESGSLRMRLEPALHCTHLYDMAMLALAYAVCPGTTRVYDIAVTDEVEGQCWLSIHSDDRMVYQWCIEGNTVTSPECYKGQPMMRGFYDWASQRFSGSALEAAILMQRGFFVSHTRRYDFKNAYGGAAVKDGLPHGSCYSYNHGVVERAYRIEGSVRDFTHSAELLLQFVDN